MRQSNISKRYPLSILTLFCFLSSVIHAQSISYRNLYDDTKLPSLYITLPPDSLTWLYAHTNYDGNLKADFVFDDGLRRDTMKNIGLRLRGNTSRDAAKKSFKVKFNAFTSGIKYQGVKELNLNGSHNDPTMIREKLFYDTWNKANLPQRRASFCKLYINANYYGLYTNIEELDDKWLQRVFANDTGNLYKCTYPADLKYISDNQNTYKIIYHAAGVRAYDLKTNETADDYSDLIRLMKTINTTADFECQIQKVLNVESFLKAYALEVLTGHWDNYGYNKNNYFLYHNPRTDLFEFISYDTDNTFGVDFLNQDWTTRNIYTWHNTQNGLLVAKLLAIPQFKKRYSFYLNSLTINVLNNLNNRIDSLKTLIRGAASLDNYRTLDYGFTFAQFEGNFDSIKINPAKFGIKQFLARRIQNSNIQLNLLPITPILNDYNVAPQNPNITDELTFSVKMDNITNISTAIFYYSKDSINFQTATLLPTNINNIYQVKIRVSAPVSRLFYRFEVGNTEGVSKLPFCGNFKLNFSNPTPTTDIFSTSIDLNIYPNPVDNQLVIHFKNNKYQYLNVELRDIRGTLQHTLFDGYSAEGEQQITYNSTNHTKGIYLLYLTFEGQRIVKKIVFN